MSRGSHRTLASSTRHRATGDGHSGGHTKCIVTVGILLPLIAAVIGIAAWSLTTGIVHDVPQSSPIYQDGYVRKGKHSDWFGERKDILEFGAKLPIGASMSKHELGPDIVPDDREVITAPEQETDVLANPSSAEPQTTPVEKDPLYVVHYVPDDKPKPEYFDQMQPPPGSENILSKILSDSKIKGEKGTPQFIVIAPVSPKEEEVDDYDDDEAEPRKIKKKERKSRRKDLRDPHKPALTSDEYTQPSNFRHQVEPAPRQYDSTETQEQLGPPPHHHQPSHHQTTPHHHQHPDLSQHPKQPVNHHQPQPHHYHHRPPPHYSQESQRHDNYYHHQHHHPTPAPAPSVSITLVPSFGLLRSLLKPKFDLKKKLFFGVQLENGIGFGGHTDAPTAAPTTKPPYHGGGGHHGGHRIRDMTLYER